MLKKILIGLGAIILVLGAAYYSISSGWFGAHEEPGEVTEQARPEAVTIARRAGQMAAGHYVGGDISKQILFGDFHVHTTFSTDAFMASLPILGGEGSHPPADACDYARFCSALDFWSITDHAENMPYRHWTEIVDTIRQCNAVAGDTQNPDTVAYLGWEWTQIGMTAAEHYGHKNVILADLDPESIPTRPIASRSQTAQALSFPRWLSVLAVVTQPEDRYWAMTRFFVERDGLDPCPLDTPVRDMPETCYEDAATPAELFRKLNDWGHRSIVIPHGTTWGFYTPPGSSWDKQLVGDMHDEDRQTMIEVYSGHGNSEEYRSWRALTHSDPYDTLTNKCPEPTEGYLPSCWRAGEIIHDRCMAAGLDEAECDQRAVDARSDYARLNAAGPLAIPGNRAEDWLESGQCTDCFQPSFNYRPGGSAQYILALTNFDDPANPRRFKMAFMASSDIHSARPGTGFKEVGRAAVTDGMGAANEEMAALGRDSNPPVPKSHRFASQEEFMEQQTNLFQALETERQSSYFQTGGLIAVHSKGRDREAIWDAIDHKEVYGTSGPRILLWFDLINGPDGKSLPMGSETAMAQTPQFRVKAVGSFKQRPGCPDYAEDALGPERLAYICKNECYNPSDERRMIQKIEVIRIRPQISPDEDVANLVDDPWMSFDCTPDANGCAISFSDPEFETLGRDAVYYARAIEEPSMTINADKLRCEYDADGNCIKVNPCYGDYRVSRSEDCLAPSAHRAWSSPIFVNQAKAAQIIARQ